MRLATVLAIVERDRALEALRSRHSTLRRAAALHLQATHSFYPSPAAHSPTAFDHMILTELAMAGPAAAERKALALLLGIMEATAFEYLQAISRRRATYAAVLLFIAPEVQARRGYPPLTAIDRAFFSAAIVFEHAGIAFGRPPVAGYEALWTQADALGTAVKQMRHLRGRMNSALRYTERQTRRVRHQTDARIMAAIAATAAAVAVLTFAWQVITS